MPTISARLGEGEKAELDDVAALLSEDRSTTIRKALSEGLATLRTGRRRAVPVRRRLRHGGRTIADCSVAEWLDVARERNLTTQLQLSDLELDADTAAEL
jgi:hypothetical protein